MRIAFSTFGCKINQFESDELKRSFLSTGNTVVPFDEPADLYVINTCTVTGKSDYQCRQAIRAAVKRGQGAKVIVTGCYAETNPEDIQKISGVTKIVGNSRKQALSEYLTLSTPVTFREPLSFAGQRRTRSVIKIQDGCESFCSYCIIPKARGKSRSIPLEDVLAQFDALIGAGVPEIVLSGIHIGKYGRDIDPSVSLTSLVKDLIKRRGHARIRLSSIEPREITPELVELLGQGLCRHLHVPLQSGDDRILKSMNRDYTSQFYLDIVSKITANNPEIAIGADVIVGFPGEGDSEFRNTLKMINDGPITHIHAFSYSPRRGTVASEMKCQVNDSDKKSRNEQVRIAGLKKNYEFRRRFLGKDLPVVVENCQTRDASSMMYYGMSDNYIRVAIKGAHPEQIGQEVRVLIDEVTEVGTLGTVC